MIFPMLLLSSCFLTKPIQSIRSFKPSSPKHVFLRADLNVPIKNGVISDDFRLTAMLPTLDYLLGQEAFIVLASHMGQPSTIDPQLSTKQLIPWFKERGYDITYQSTLTANPTERASKITLLENLRFFPGEKNQNLDFAKSLALLADVYVNDAFGTMHRNDTSITLLAEQFTPENRYIGLLVEKEITELEKLKTNPQQPFMLILGGSKLDDKTPLLRNFINAQADKRPQTIMLGGVLALAFLTLRDGSATQHLRMNATLSQKTLQTARELVQLAEKNKVRLVLPTDLMVIRGELGSTPEVCSIKEIPENSQCVDIGPETAKNFRSIINTAGSIFANGTMGIYEYPAYQMGTRTVLQAIANSKSYSVIGGGDTASAVHHEMLEKKMTFISTGGGATLEYLGAQDPWQELPGLKALVDPESSPRRQGEHA